MPTASLALALIAAFTTPLSLVHAQTSVASSTNSPAREGNFTFISSSAFEMVLYPTLDPLDAIAANKVEHAIKTSLLLSTSITTNFLTVEDINVLLRRIEYKKVFEPLNPLSNFFTNTSASTLEFTVETSFLINAENEDARLPSKNALDNLIVRTFSQPSSKASFILTLGLARDPILNEVMDIQIDIVKELVAPPIIEDARTLSTIDVVLIIASVFIFLGIIAVIWYYHNSRTEGEQDRPTDACRAQKKTSEADKSNSIQIDTSNSKESIYIDTPSSSPKEENSKETELDLVTEETNHLVPSDMMPFEENIVEGSSLESSVDGQSGVLPTTESPDASYASSTASTTRHSNSAGSCSSSEGSDNSDSGSESSSSHSSSSVSEIEDPIEHPTNDKDGATAPSMLLGAEQPNYCDSSVSSSSHAGNLTSRLLNLSSISTFDLTRRFNLYSSSSSAPAILEDVREDESSVDGRKLDDKSVFSARSASSESFDSGRQAHSESYTRGKRGYWIGSSFRDMAQQFHENWVESKRKALEDIEEGSVEDVFQIDVERAAAAEEDRSKASGKSSVSEWMKNIQVVGSASETQSSLEHSSVEPSSYTKENNSIDLSLEQSLATSLVEV
ncbi:hypothetical protein IV203_005567 [Nitzschia inconspicua]|uniref:Uncharacterized protein n=1 Tax=Nitzschia inconspicua TaxID=303405 RepID=A0A9K3PIU6_9STRA|nr:hypothetical protein IV203_005567 [Nitzschia inconspicua]